MPTGKLGHFLRKRGCRAGLTKEGEAGFTLLELMIVMLIVAILASVAIPAYLASIKAAKEAVLKEDLHVMRGAIDAYTADKGKAPQSLDDLVQAGYLKKIPTDPMTHSDTTWVTATDDTLQNIDQSEPGVNDVHSGAQETGSDDQPYSSW